MNLIVAGRARDKWESWVWIELWQGAGRNCVLCNFRLKCARTLCSVPFTSSLHPFFSPHFSSFQNTKRTNSVSAAFLSPPPLPTSHYQVALLDCLDFLYLPSVLSWFVSVSCTSVAFCRVVHATVLFTVFLLFCSALLLLLPLQMLLPVLLVIWGQIMFPKSVWCSCISLWNIASTSYHHMKCWFCFVHLYYS